MQQRRDGRQADAGGLRQRIHLDVGRRRLKRPRRMMNVDAEQAIRGVDRVQTIPLGEEVLERTLHRLLGFTYRTVARMVLGPALRAPSVVLDGAAAAPTV